MTDKLRNTNPVHIGFRAIDLYRAYLEHGLTETVASVAAIGELKMELDDLEREDEITVEAKYERRFIL